MCTYDFRPVIQNSTIRDISEGLFICLVFLNNIAIPVIGKPTFTFQIKAS